MLKMFGVPMQKCFKYIIKIFKQVWNEYNDYWIYIVPKNSFKTM
jgi:UDP-3-O-acyl-N-acetylglucosamine deacetylase